MAAATDDKFDPLQIVVFFQHLNQNISSYSEEELEISSNATADNLGITLTRAKRLFEQTEDLRTGERLHFAASINPLIDEAANQILENHSINLEGFRHLGPAKLKSLKRYIALMVALIKHSGNPPRLIDEEVLKSEFKSTSKDRNKIILKILKDSQLINQHGQPIIDTQKDREKILKVAKYIINLDEQLLNIVRNQPAQTQTEPWHTFIDWATLDEGSEIDWLPNFEERTPAQFLAECLFEAGVRYPRLFNALVRATNESNAAKGDLPDQDLKIYANQKPGSPTRAAWNASVNETLKTLVAGIEVTQIEAGQALPEARQLEFELLRTFGQKLDQISYLINKPYEQIERAASL